MGNCEEEAFARHPFQRSLSLSLSLSFYMYKMDIGEPIKARIAKQPLRLISIVIYTSMTYITFHMTTTTIQTYMYMYITTLPARSTLFLLVYKYTFITTKPKYITNVYCNSTNVPYQHINNYGNNYYLRIGQV